VRVAIKNNFARIASRLRRIEVAAKSQYTQEITTLAKGIEQMLERETPSRTGKMASGWTSRVIGGSPKGRVPVAAWIWNEWAEKKRQKYGSRDFAIRFTNLETGRINTRRTKVKTDGATVLRVLEYGSTPHMIRPAHATAKGHPGMLRFEVDGETVFARSVMHPGTRPYGMIRRARRDARKKLRQINEKVARTARQVLTGAA